MAKKDKTLTLKLDWSKAKSLQWAIAVAKPHVKKGTQTMKELRDIESQLEDFTESASLIINIG